MGGGDCEIGKCEVCGTDNQVLTRTYFMYPVGCECHSPSHFELVRHCSTCVPKEPMETKLVLKTSELKHPYDLAIRLLKADFNTDRSDYSNYQNFKIELARLIMINSDLTMAKASAIADAFIGKLIM
jgi:1,4-dihydroxy-2-naphthoyl-CoA synthase